MPAVIVLPWLRLRLRIPKLALRTASIYCWLAIGIAWVFATDDWERTDPEDPGKVLVLKMVQSVRPQLEYVVQSGSSIAEQARKNLDRLRGAPEPVESKE